MMGYRVIILFVFHLLFSINSYADILYTNLSNTDIFSGNSRTVTGTSQFGGGNNPAYTFTPTISGSVSEIDLGLSGSVIASLWTAGPGYGTGVYSSSHVSLAPLIELGSWTVSSANSLIPGTSIASITGITGVSLNAGQKYYLELSAATPTTIAYWFDNVEGALGNLWQCGGSDSSYSSCLGYTSIGTATSGAFRIQSVSSVPIPTAIWLFGSALAGFGLFGRRKIA